MAWTKTPIHPAVGAGICGFSATETISANGNSSSLDITGLRYVSVYVNNGATEDCDFTVEGSLDGSNWETIAYGSGAFGGYTQASLNVPISTTTHLYLPPDDFLRFIRFNVSDANTTAGTVFTVYAVRAA